MTVFWSHFWMFPGLGPVDPVGPVGPGPVGQIAGKSPPIFFSVVAVSRAANFSEWLRPISCAGGPFGEGFGATGLAFCTAPGPRGQTLPLRCSWPQVRRMGQLRDRRPPAGTDGPPVGCPQTAIRGLGLGGGCRRDGTLRVGFPNTRGRLGLPWVQVRALGRAVPSMAAGST